MRVTNAPASRKRRIRTIKAAKGFRLRRSKLYRYAADALDHGRYYAFRDRKTRKRNFRMLWQARINAATRELGVTYSRFMEGLKAASISLDRKILADIAATDEAGFNQLVKASVDALKAKGGKKATPAAPLETKSQRNKAAKAEAAKQPKAPKAPKTPKA